MRRRARILADKQQIKRWSTLKVKPAGLAVMPKIMLRHARRYLDRRFAVASKVAHGKSRP
jgi:hypothetical protein